MNQNNQAVETKKITLYDVQEYYGSYINDLEWSLEQGEKLGDSESWADYQKDPAPYLNDMFNDFNNGNNGQGWTPDQIAQAVNWYLGR